MTEWPFDPWLRRAVVQHHLSPAQFWDMSLRDWLVLIAPQDRGVLPRARLDELLKFYPDEALYDPD